MIKGDKENFMSHTWVPIIGIYYIHSTLCSGVLKNSMIKTLRKTRAKMYLIFVILVPYFNFQVTCQEYSIHVSSLLVFASGLPVHVRFFKV